MHTAVAVVHIRALTHCTLLFSHFRKQFFRVLANRGQITVRFSSHFNRAGKSRQMAAFKPVLPLAAEADNLRV